MKIALLFPDYGSQFVGMAKELYDQSRIIQEYFEEASTCLNTNFVKLCFASSEFELSQIAHAYTALFLVSSSITALLKEKGIVPSMVAGVGIGEFSAAAASGSLSLPDGLYFLSKYAQFYNELLETIKVRAIKVIELPSATVQNICLKESAAAIAVVETNHELMITGPTQEIERIEKMMQDAGGHCFEKPKELGLHSPLMDSALQQLRVYLEKIDYRDAEIPLVASTNGAALREGKLIQEEIMMQLQTTIRWDLVMEKIAEQADLIVEVGPGVELTQLFKKVYPNIPVMSINKPSDIEDLVTRITQSTQK